MMALDITQYLVDLACDCCGKRDEELLLRKPGLISGAIFNIVRCRECGFVYVNPRLNEEGNASIYSGAYYSGEGFDTSVSYVDDYAKTKDTDKAFHPLLIAQTLRKYQKPPARLLDFGCGLGDLMRQAGSLGYDVEGYEVSAFARDFARGHGFTVYDKLDDIPSASYDLISAVEVIEHCFQPSVVFSAIHRALRPGGVFVYTTMNVDRFLLPYRLGLVKDNGYLAPEGHINFFNRNVVKRYFRQAGFSGLLPSFDPLNAGMRGKIRLAIKRAMGFDLPAARK